MQAKLLQLFCLATVAICLLANDVTGRPQSSDESEAGSVLSSGQSEDDQLVKDIDYLREKTAHLAALSDKIKKSMMSSRSGHHSGVRTRMSRGISKRPLCWSTVDVCCLFNIC